MKRKPKLVHFTHHTCLANGLGVDTVYDRLYDDEAGQYHHQKDRYQQTYGTYARSPAAFGPLHCRYATRTSLLTTEIADVTCESCLRSLENDSRESLFEKASRPGILDHDKQYYEQRAEAWCSDKELKIRAWLICCHQVSAPRPMSQREAVKRVRAGRARFLESAVAGAVFTWACMGDYTERLTKALAKVSPEERELMRDAIERAKEADALFNKAQKITASINALAQTAAKHVRTRGAVSLSASKSEAA